MLFQQTLKPDILADMGPKDGFKPPTRRLQIGRSVAELLGQSRSTMSVIINMVMFDDMRRLGTLFAARYKFFDGQGKPVGRPHGVMPAGCVTGDTFALGSSFIIIARGWSKVGAPPYVC